VLLLERELPDNYPWSPLICSHQWFNYNMWYILVRSCARALRQSSGCAVAVAPPAHRLRADCVVAAQWCSIAFAGFVMSFAGVRQAVEHHRKYKGGAAPCRCPACARTECFSKLLQQTRTSEDRNDGMVTCDVSA
jgi:hypothetical protein